MEKPQKLKAKIERRHTLAEKMMRGSFGINPEERESKSVPQSLCLVTQ